MTVNLILLSGFWWAREKLFDFATPPCNAQNNLLNDFRLCCYVVVVVIVVVHLLYMYLYWVYNNKVLLFCRFRVCSRASLKADHWRPGEHCRLRRRHRGRGRSRCCHRQVTSNDPPGPTKEPPGHRVLRILWVTYS